MTSQLDALRAQVGRRRARRGLPHVVAVTSGRGGAGVSLVSALLAIRGAQAGLKTLLVDAEPWLDVQRVWLGLDKGRSLAEVGSDPVESLVTHVHGSLDLLSLGGGPSTDRQMPPSSPPLRIVHGLRSACHAAAYSTSGSAGLNSTSTTPVVVIESGT